MNKLSKELTERAISSLKVEDWRTEDYLFYDTENFKFDEEYIYIDTGAKDDNGNQINFVLKHRLSFIDKQNLIDTVIDSAFSNGYAPEMENLTYKTSIFLLATNIYLPTNDNGEYDADIICEYWNKLPIDMMLEQIYFYKELEIEIRQKINYTKELIINSNPKIDELYDVVIALATKVGGVLEGLQDRIQDVDLKDVVKEFSNVLPFGNESTSEENIVEDIIEGTTEGGDK